MKVRDVLNALLLDREPEGKKRFENGKTDRFEQARKENIEASRTLAQKARQIDLGAA